MKVIVASTNPVKIEGTKDAFQRTFPEVEFAFEGTKVSSGVKDQPDTDEETIRGARNRIAALRILDPSADYYVGLEGGVEKIDGKMFAFAWAVVANHTGKIGEARTASFMLPPQVASLIEEGVELGHANDQVFGTENSKQKNGALGILTNDLITRTSEYSSTIILALVPFQKYQELYN